MRRTASPVTIGARVPVEGTRSQRLLFEPSDDALQEVTTLALTPRGRIVVSVAGALSLVAVGAVATVGVSQMADLTATVGIAILNSLMGAP